MSKPITKKQRKKKIVYIKWADAFHQEPCRWNSWKKINEFFNDPDFQVETVGWIIKEDKEYILISPMKSLHDNSFGHIQKIPKGTIIEKKIL